MARPVHHGVLAIGFTAALILLVSFALTDVINGFVLLMLAAVIGSVAFFYWLFPGSRFFSIALANFLAVYACVFVFFVEANFVSAHFEMQLAGFLLPIVAFLVGSWRRRDEIRAIVTAEQVREERQFGRVLLWLVPVFAVGAVSFLVPHFAQDRVAFDFAFLLAMGVISVIVLFVSRDVSTFLIDTGLLFEDFFKRMAMLVVPAFAFLTFYSLLIIVFGAVYRIVDRFSAMPAFKVEGVARHITFPEGLYFSIVTLSTVGYGDVIPASDLSRAIVSVQMICGILLLLFGFSEIIAYTRDRRERRGK